MGPGTMSTREHIKMQSINFCYMDYMLQALKTDSVEIGVSGIKEIFKDGDTISALMEDGEVRYAIDLDPEVSTAAIKAWIANNPEQHECVIALMNA